MSSECRLGEHAQRLARHDQHLFAQRTFDAQPVGGELTIGRLVLPEGEQRRVPVGRRRVGGERGVHRTSSPGCRRSPEYIASVEWAKRSVRRLDPRIHAAISLGPTSPPIRVRRDCRMDCRIRPGNDDQTAARMERSAIRDRRFSPQSRPGFRCAPSGLRFLSPQAPPPPPLHGLAGEVKERGAAHARIQASLVGRCRPVNQSVHRVHDRRPAWARQHQRPVGRSRGLG